MKLSSLISPFRPADGPPPGKLWPFFRWALRGAFPVLGVSAGASALAGTTEVVSALLLGWVIDGAIAAGPDFITTDWPRLLVLALFFLVFRPAVFATSVAFQGIAVSPNVYPLVLSRLNRWTLGHSVTFFDNDFAGRIAQKQMQTATAMTNVVTEMVNIVSFALASLIGSALLLTSIDERIALVLGVWLVGYLFLIRHYLPKVKVRASARAGARAALTGQIVDVVTNVKTVKLFASQQAEDAAARDGMETYRKVAISFGQMTALFRLLLIGLAGVLPVLLIGGALVLWSWGQSTAGDIAAAGAVSIRIAQMSGWVSMGLMTLYSNIGEAQDGMRTLTPAHDLVDRPNAVPLQVTDGEIRFDDVSFAYGRRTGGVSGISLTVAPGEKLGIVGASGAGKSTLVALLMRLYDAEGGRILIDGQDIETVTQDSLRAQIAMVTQDTAMFNRSARDNIRYGSDAQAAAVEAAACAAEAHEFIQGLRDMEGRTGYDAYLGERGVRLSGGQRQRIALARAILKDAPILVLDEATSALDSELEASIQDALDRVMTGKTVLAIAHRLSTIARMDRIIVLEEGEIAESGTHTELLSRGGLYARYWHRQSGGFIHCDEAAE